MSLQGYLGTVRLLVTCRGHPPRPSVRSCVVRAAPTQPAQNGTLPRPPAGAFQGSAPGQFRWVPPAAPVPKQAGRRAGEKASHGTGLTGVLLGGGALMATQPRLGTPPSSGRCLPGQPASFPQSQPRMPHPQEAGWSGSLVGPGWGAGRSLLGPTWLCAPGGGLPGSVDPSWWSQAPGTAQTSCPGPALPPQ